MARIIEVSEVAFAGLGGAAKNALTDVNSSLLAVLAFLSSPPPGPLARPVLLARWKRLAVFQQVPTRINITAFRDV
jgi:hypothetical protein